MPLGILDWGIGGLGFVRLLKERHPGVPVVYLSDAGEVPYGALPAEALTYRVGCALGLLRGLGARRVVVACNAASTVLPRISEIVKQGDAERIWGPLPSFTGIIDHGIDAVASEVSLRGGVTVGVIGGRRTILSGMYRRPLVGRGFEIRQRVAQPLSALIERGDVSSGNLIAQLRTILAPLRGCDHLLLACTHYAAITPAITELLPGTHIIDPVVRLLDWIEVAWGIATSSPEDRSSIEDRYLTTGDRNLMSLAARRAFGVVIDRVEGLPQDLHTT
jgi:glutamate racemase